MTQARPENHHSTARPPTHSAPPERVLLVTEYFHPHVGGIETHVLALATQLNAASVHAEVATPFPGPELVAGIRVHRIRAPLLRGLHTVFTTHAARPFLDLVHRGRYDLVHCHISIYNPGAIGIAYLAHRARLPVIVTWHSVLTGYTQAYRALDVITGWSRLPVTFSAVSPGVASQLAPLLGDQSVRVLPSSVDPTAWMRAGRHAADPHMFRVASTMRLAKRKRPRALIEVLALVRDRLPAGMRLRANIFGDGGQREMLTRLIDKRGLAGLVHLPGPQTHEQLREEYADSDVFVLPSVEESFGLAALEARAAGLPVVVRASSGAAQFVVDGQDGLIVTSDSHLAAALVRLARDPELRATIAEHNRRTPPPFGPDEATRLHLEAYTAARNVGR